MKSVHDVAEKYGFEVARPFSEVDMSQASTTRVYYTLNPDDCWFIEIFPIHAYECYVCNTCDGMPDYFVFNGEQLDQWLKEVLK